MARRGLSILAGLALVPPLAWTFSCGGQRTPLDDSRSLLTGCARDVQLQQVDGLQCTRCPTRLRAWPKRGDGYDDDEGGYDNDDEEGDDEPPDLSTSPQEFLYRMQQRKGLDVAPAPAPRPEPKARPTFNNNKSSFSSSGGGLGRGGKKGGGGGGSKDTTVFVCTSCGNEFLQWRGKCTACGEWNTIQEYRAASNGSRKSTGGLGRGLNGGGRPPTFGDAFRKSGASWLDGIDGGGGVGGGGGPVRVTDVYEDILSDSDGGEGSSWDDAYARGAKEWRTSVPDDSEMNSVLGGGLMPGSICLVGGDPGVGKSTLLLQMAGSVASMAERSLQFQGVGMGPPQPSPTTPSEGETEPAGENNKAPKPQQQNGGPVLYVSGEENANQIASRALRLGIQDPELLLWCETDADYIADMVANAAHNDLAFDDQMSDDLQSTKSPPLSKLPSLVIIDSIQTMLCDAAGASAAGGITQVRECVGLFLRLAKSTGVPVMLVGHVTKSGDVAGPRTVEHMVDSVLYLEGGGLLGSGGSDGTGGVSSLRILRAAKNRFGSSEEVGVYEMGRGGRLVPVSDPSSFFLSTRQDNADAEGCAISVVLEGIRSMTVEVQALVAWSAGSGGYSGRRIVYGVSNSRLLLILAVLQKRYGISFHRRDVYVNVVGGMRLGSGTGSGGGSDLAVAVALVSSLLGIPVRTDTAFVGEVGLLGELRPVHSLEKRIGEARRMGFSRIVAPSSASGKKKKKVDAGPKEVSVGGITQIMCDNVLDAVNCGLVDSLPTRRTRSGPKLIKPKRESREGGSRRGARQFGMDEMDVILDDEEDDIFE
ncbi:hypothetical protein ACHAXT_010947 [Thalassiosira profunda]